MKIEEMIAARRSNCTGCEACANVCPKTCISMTADAEGFYYPVIDKSKCIECGQCDRTCPILNFRKSAQSKLSKAFAAINRDWNVRRKSSSGGVFTALAEIILNRGGIVFGAAFDGDWNVIHVAVDSVEGLEKLRGSKYVQSRIGDVYRRVKSALDSERDVMFVGTPCQVAGLKHYLRRDYERLILVDTACKGVAPPVLWKNYIDYRGRGHDISSVAFRSKRVGWYDSHFEIVFKDRGHYSVPINDDLYAQGFQLGLDLRPSCGECRFKGVERLSDLTLADFWGVQQVESSMFDNRGTSLVLLHTEKGERLLKRTRLLFRQTDLSKAVEHNPCLFKSSPSDERRANFFKDLSRPNADPIAVLDKYYLYDYRRQAQRLQMLLYSKRENILFVTMYWEGGGTNIFIDHYVAAHCQGAGAFVLNQLGNRLVIYNHRAPTQRYVIEKNAQSLTSLVRQLNITRLFINHFITFDLPFIVNWVQRAGLPFDYFIHDYFCVCPNYMLDCFAKNCSQSLTNPECRRHFDEIFSTPVSIEKWRGVFYSLLTKAEHIIAPSQYAANIVKKFFPSLNIEVRSHRVELPLSRTFRAEFALRERLRIVFLGFMRREKGERYLLLMNEFIRREGLPIELIVIGEFRDDVTDVGTKEGLLITGKYDNRRTSELLAQHGAGLVATLSDWYETYCYTASEAMLSGYPVLSMNIGAHALRIRKHDCGWLIPINSPSGGIEELKQFLRFIVTEKGRQQILSKAANTVKFINGVE